MTTEELAWAAGLFEGEGCFSVRRDRAFALRMEIAMTDRDVVERFAALVGVGTVHYLDKREPRCKPQWRWTVGGQEAIDLGLALEPWLGLRRSARLREILAWRADHMAEATRPRTCPTCGKVFYPSWSRVVTRQDYCSKKCAWPMTRHVAYKRAWRAKRREKGLPVT